MPAAVVQVNYSISYHPACTSPSLPQPVPPPAPACAATSTSLCRHQHQPLQATMAPKKTTPTRKQQYETQIVEAFTVQALNDKLQQPLLQGHLDDLKDHAWVLTNLLAGFEPYNSNESLKDELATVFRHLTSITQGIESYNDVVIKRFINPKKRVDNLTRHIYDGVWMLSLVMVVYSFCQAANTFVAVFGNEGLPSNGPTIAGPTIAGPTIAGPTIDGPTIAGPTIDGQHMIRSNCEYIVLSVSAGAYLFGKFLSIQQEAVIAQSLLKNEKDARTTLVNVIDMCLQEIVSVCDKNKDAIRDLQHNNNSVMFY